MGQLRVNSAACGNPVMNGPIPNSFVAGNEGQFCLGRMLNYFAAILGMDQACRYLSWLKHEDRGLLERENRAAEMWASVHVGDEQLRCADSASDMVPRDAAVCDRHAGARD